MQFAASAAGATATDTLSPAMDAKALLISSPHRRTFKHVTVLGGAFLPVGFCGLVTTACSWQDPSLAPLLRSTAKHLRHPKCYTAA